MKSYERFFLDLSGVVAEVTMQGMLKYANTVKKLGQAIVGMQSEITWDSLYYQEKDKTISESIKDELFHPKKKK